MLDISKFKDLYISETEDQLQKLNDSLLILEKINQGQEEKSKQKDVLNSIMRASHTVKGSSATMGFNEMAYLTHVMEDVFYGVINATVVMTQELMDLIFEAVDDLEKSLESIKKTNKEGALSKIADRIKKTTGVSTSGVGKSARDDSAIADTKTESAKKAEVVTETVRPNLLACQPDEQAEEDSVQSAIKKIEYIKVPITRLDSLMDLVEELVIDRMRLQELTDTSPKVKEIYDHLNLLTQSIQYEVMQSRLVPVEQVFARFPRMIRDLSQKLDKNITFDMSGGEMELDRSIVDRLGEPLVHLLRNAVDHGTNKEGKVLLSAQRIRENAVISVTNTGRDIDVAKIGEVAMRKGLTNAREIKTLTEDQVISFIFNDNFSTKDEVTEVSGRGVGLSVVRSFVESLNGRLTVKNMKPGARFTMELPLNLAIINSLLVRIDKFIYAIPFSSIERSASIDFDNIKKMADYNIGILDGIKIPLIDLRSLFGIEKRIDDTARQSQTVVLVRKGEELAGLIVDSLMAEQEITVKPLSSVLKGVRGFSGSAILGDGQMVLILDVAGLMKDVVASK